MPQMNLKPDEAGRDAFDAARRAVAAPGVDEPSRTDFALIGGRVIERVPEIREQVRMELAAAAFRSRLEAELGPGAVLRVRIAEDGLPTLSAITRRGPGTDVPVDNELVRADARRDADGWHVDLWDPVTGVVIEDALVTKVGDFAFPIIALHVPAPLTSPEPATVVLPDGRVATEEVTPEGRVVRYVHDEDGRRALAPDGQRLRWGDPGSGA